MNEEIPSGCGNYVAYISGSILLIFSKSPSDDTYAYDLTEIICKHRDANGYDRVSNVATIKYFKWELPINEICSKFAVYISHGLMNAVVIIELFELKPIIIEADPGGVASIQWINGPKLEFGSYKNCTQIAVFLAGLLDVKVYSLLTTNVQFTIPKPFTSELIFHPTRINIWSIVVTPYYAKNLMSRSVLRDESSIRPVILHFWTDGTTSKLLASLKMDFLPGADSQFFWSLSGRWLFVFDPSSSLSGFLFSAYNSLGLHNKAVKDVSAHTAIPTVRHTCAPICLSEGEDLEWSPLLASEDGQDFVYMTSISNEMIVTYKCLDILTMLILKAVTIPLTSGAIWSQTVDTKGSVKYSKIRYIPLIPTEKWRLIHRKDNSMILAAGNLLVALDLTDKTVEVEFTIVATLLVIDARVLKEKCFLIAYTDHIAVCKSTSIKLLTTSEYHFKLVDIQQTQTAINVRTIEDYPSGPRWDTFPNVLAILSSQSPQKLAGPSIDDEDITTQTKDSSERSHEITDTFYKQKRRKII